MVNFSETNIIDDFHITNSYDSTGFNEMFQSSKRNLIVHFNIRSFRANYDEFSVFLNSLAIQPSIIILSETWFSEDFTDHINGYKGFHSFRLDRVGGGISIFVRSELNASSIDFITKCDNNIEVCGANVQLNNSFYLNIFGIYRPPSGNLLEFNDYISNNILNKYSANSHVIMGGDFNLNLLNPSNIEMDIISNFFMSAYVPMINGVTRETNTSGTCIDNLWYNHNEFDSGIFKLQITDHYPIFGLLTSFDNSLEFTTKSFRDHSKKNIDNLTVSISKNIQIFDRIDSDDLEYNSQLFINLIYNLYNKFCPIRNKKISIKNLMKPWITKTLKMDINRKHSFFKDYLGGRMSFECYKSYSNVVTKKIKLAKIIYYKQKFSNFRLNSRKTWQYINSLMHNKCKDAFSDDFVIRDDSRGIDVRNKNEICNLLNNHFVNIGTKLNNDLPASNMNPTEFMTSEINASFYARPSTPNEVYNVIVGLKSKSSGLFSVPVFIYKLLNPLISKILSNQFNISVRLGIFPKCAKIAKVIPLYKSGSKKDPSNYRPISLLNTYSKIFEKLMLERMLNYIDGMFILNEKQFGFRKLYNTSDAILEFLSDIVSCLESNSYLISVFIDFSKAFDCISHDILLQKMSKFGFYGSYLKWFESYLSNRQQYLQLNADVSDRISIKTGVPQGSILGPLLFNLYINDMSFACGGLKSIHFADDTTLYASGKNIDSLVSNINGWMIGIDSWLRANKLTLNFNKTFVMTFTNKHLLFTPQISMRGVTFQITSKLKFLGITLDDKLKFKEHAMITQKKISRVIGTVRRIRNCIDDSILHRLYYSLVYPHLTYGIVAWGNSSIGCINGMSIIQKRFIKFFSSPMVENSYTFLSYRSIYKYFVCIKFFKCFYQELHPYFGNIIKSYIPGHNHPTRFSETEGINLPRFRLASSQTSFLYSAIITWNTLPLDLRKSASLDIFKKQLKLFFLEKQNI